MSTEILYNALQLARRGIGTFPLIGGAKEPFFPNPHPKDSPERQTCKGECGRLGHGLYDATTDRTRLETWFGVDHGLNLGAALPDNVAVIDVDPRNGGWETLIGWCDEHGDAWFDEAQWLAVTGGGGFHLGFKRPPGPLCDPGEGIECLRSPHYVIVPPSMTANEYAWRRVPPLDLDDLGEMPAWLAELCAFTDDKFEQSIPAPRRTYVEGGDRLDRVAHAHTSWRTLLERHGWRLVRGDGDSDGSRWRHPTSANKISATIKYGCLFVYSHRTDFDQTSTGEARGYTMFRAIAMLDFGGDMKAARKQLVGDDDRSVVRRWMATTKSAQS